MEKERLALNQGQLDRLKDYWDVFDSPSGQRVLDDMEKTYCSLPYTTGDSHDTARKVGNMEVIMDIKRMMEFKKMPIEIEEEQEEPNKF